MITYHSQSSYGLVGRAGAKQSRGPGFETALVASKCQKPGFESLLEAPNLCSIARPAFPPFIVFLKSEQTPNYICVIWRP